MWRTLSSLLVISILVVSGCVEKKEIGKLEIRLNFSEFPKKYTLEGENTSPRIEISGIGDNVKSLVIILEDPDAPSKTFIHWLIWNIEPAEIIPENIPKKPEVTEPIKALQGRNDFGRIGYDGPHPPPGEVHRYFFRVYALGTMLDLSPGVGREELENAMKRHVIGYGEAMATYGR